MFTMIPFWMISLKSPILYPIIPNEKDLKEYKGHVQIYDKSTRSVKIYVMKYTSSSKASYSKCNTTLNREYCRELAAKKNAIIDIKYFDPIGLDRIVVNSKSPVVTYSEVFYKSEALNKEILSINVFFRKIFSLILIICILYIFLKLVLSKIYLKSP